jgi:hypothetical protein
MIGRNKLFPFGGYRGPVLAFGSALGAVASVAGTVMSYNAQKDQAKAQQESIAAQSRAAAVEEARKRTQAIREARIKRAMIENAAGNQQVGGSGLTGGTSAVSSQLASNINYSNQMQSFGAQASAANQRAADAGASASMWQGIGSLAGSMTNWQSIFNPSGVPSVNQMQTSAQKPNYFKTVN